MKKFIFHSLKKNELGVSLIEFALVIWALLFLLMGIAEFGWLFNGWITLTGAAREGARVASIYQDPDDTEGIVSAEVAKHTSIFESVSVNTERVFYKAPQGGGQGQGQLEEYGITVEVNGTIKPLINFFIRTDTVTLYAEATMRAK